MSMLSISNIAWDVADDAAVCDMLLQRQITSIDLAPSKYFPSVTDASTVEIDYVRRWWNDRGITLLGMQSLLFGTQGLDVFGDATVKGRLLKHLEAVFRTGERLGISRAVFGSPRNRDKGNLTDEEARQQATHFFRDAGDLAGSYNVVLCLEPNPPLYGANFMTNVVSTAAVVRSVDHPFVAMQWDTGAMFVNEESPAVMTAHAGLVGHIHISQPDLLPIGTGSFDHFGMAKAMAKLQTNLPRTIEMLPPQDGLAGIAQALDFVVATYRAGGSS